MCQYGSCRLACNRLTVSNKTISTGRNFCLLTYRLSFTLFVKVFCRREQLDGATQHASASSSGRLRHVQRTSLHNRWQHADVWAVAQRAAPWTLHGQRGSAGSVDGVLGKWTGSAQRSVRRGRGEVRGHHSGSRGRGWQELDGGRVLAHEREGPGVSVYAVARVSTKIFEDAEDTVLNCPRGKLCPFFSLVNGHICRVCWNGHGAISLLQACAVSCGLILRHLRAAPWSLAYVLLQQLQLSHFTCSLLWWII